MLDAGGWKPSKTGVAHWSQATQWSDKPLDSRLSPLDSLWLLLTHQGGPYGNQGQNQSRCAQVPF
jgi:hypothetical protein